MDPIWSAGRTFRRSDGCRVLQHHWSWSSRQLHDIKFGPRPSGQSESIIRIATKLAREAKTPILDGYLLSAKLWMAE